MNWDNPLPNFKGGHINDFTAHHNLKNCRLWPDVYELFGLGRNYDFDPDHFAKVYLNYCKFMLSPLYEELA